MTGSVLRDASSYLDLMSAVTSNRPRSRRWAPSRPKASVGTTYRWPPTWLMAAWGIDPSGRGSMTTDCLPSAPVETSTTSPVTRVTLLTVGGATEAGLAAGWADAAEGDVRARPARRATAARTAGVRTAFLADRDMRRFLSEGQGLGFDIT